MATSPSTLHLCLHLAFSSSPFPVLFMSPLLTWTFVIRFRAYLDAPGWCYLEILNSIAPIKSFFQIRSHSQFWWTWLFPGITEEGSLQSTLVATTGPFHLVTSSFIASSKEDSSHCLNDFLFCKCMNQRELFCWITEWTPRSKLWCDPENMMLENFPGQYSQIYLTELSQKFPIAGDTWWGNWSCCLVLPWSLTDQWADDPFQIW